MSSKEDIFWQLEGLRQVCKRRSQSGRLDASLNPGSALMLVVENAVLLDACTSRYTNGGFRGFTNRFEGWEQTVETEGCREPVIGIDARARESCVCGYGSCLRAAANGRVRKLVHGKRWGYLEGGVGW